MAIVVDLRTGDTHRPKQNNGNHRDKFTDNSHVLRVCTIGQTQQITTANPPQQNHGQLFTNFTNFTSSATRTSPNMIQTTTATASILMKSRTIPTRGGQIFPAEKVS
jgi:hypothetical protein